jgi:hypothetical protein
MKKLLISMLVILPIAGCSASIGPTPTATSTTYTTPATTTTYATPVSKTTTVTKTNY